MIKRIIFDLDNTLLMWKSEYIFALTNVLKDLCLDVTSEEIKNFDSNLGLYEEEYTMYNKEDFMKFTNNYFKSNIPDIFYDMLKDYQKDCYIIDEELISTLKYLKSKYDLVVLTNWFTSTQVERLKNAEILEYFTFVSGGDERVFKPSIEAFNIVLDGYKPSECIMVGDSFKCDIEPANKIGMDTYWVTNENSTKYKTISRVHKLKDIL